QTRAREAREDYCAEAGIPVFQRGSAGGALYLDAGQQCFTLTVPSDRLGATLGARLEAGAALVADALARLGVATEFKAPNDLQVAGRQKIASVFLADQGGSTQIFGVILAELDLKAAMQALLVPTEKLTITGLEHARERMTSLAEVLGRVPSSAEIGAALAAAATQLGLRLEPGAVEAAAEIDAPLSDDWVLSGSRFETKDKVPCATLRVLMGLSAENRVEHLRFATDGHIAPADGLARLAAALVGVDVDDLADTCRTWFAAVRPDLAGFEAEDVARLIDRAASKWRMQADLGLTPVQTSGLMLAGDGRDPAQVLAEASVMLVPYCAKPNWCKWRHTIDCVECGKCEVGDAYMLARDRNMEVVTITNFEHLAETLKAMKGAGVTSYVGMCCGEFFLKRHHAFRDSGMDAVLLDIEGATCYELKEENLAYAGQFSAEAALDLDAVQKVMAKVPVQPLARRPCLSGDTARVGERHHALVSGGCSACSCGKSEG
ncbi:MAG: DUF116 domain-containing protein, partial [Paracoccaceae bacterium]|nr:DUF116 domain-containing protein [Paracoccaceae bacterium]